MLRSARVSLALVLVLVAAGVVVAAAASGPAPAPRPVANVAFPSAARPGAPAVVWALGDGDGTAAGRQVAQRIAAGDPDRVLYLGDVYEAGSPKEFRTNFSAIYGALAERMVPTPGNHEWPSHPTGYDRFWRGLTGSATPPWYALRIGGWRVLSLNSEAPHGARSAQLRWLRARVREARGTCTLAFWHRPRFSAGKHGDQADTAPLWQALRGHASLVLSGHDHVLERLRPRDGLTQLVVGAGGRKRHDVDEDDRRLAWASDEHFGALRLALRPGRADLAFVAGDGTVLDRSTTRCATG